LLSSARPILGGYDAILSLAVAHGAEPVTYRVRVEQVLAKTFGVPIFQEQVLRWR